MIKRYHSSIFAFKTKLKTWNAKVITNHKASEPQLCECNTDKDIEFILYSWIPGRSYRFQSSSDTSFLTYIQNNLFINKNAITPDYLKDLVISNSNP